MTLITKSQYMKLVKAGYDNKIPIIKLFVENITWLVTGIEDGILYGFGDIGQQCVEWGGLIHEDELPTLKGRISYMERDRYFVHKKETNYLDFDTLIGI